ncbi:MAG: response regulator receiver [Bacteroidetes bacterium]|jgi:FixJ family two-component response regulator|nr:response regulator receiver [Bacteroidota bacterium]
MGEPVVYIIDDDRSVRQAISLFLSSAGYSVISFSSSEEFLEQEPGEETGCIILDVNLGGKTGLELQDELIGLDYNLPVIFITGRGNVRMSVATMKKGAVNFLEKPFNDEELLKSVADAVQLSRKLVSEKAEVKRASELLSRLTPRETEILSLLVTGMLNKQIGSDLNIAEQTVKLHRHSIFEKLGVKSLPGLVRITDIAGFKPSGRIQ